jgi:hypothetical protein
VVLRACSAATGGDLQRDGLKPDLGAARTRTVPRAPIGYDGDPEPGELIPRTPDPCNEGRARRSDSLVGCGRFSVLGALRFSDIWRLIGRGLGRRRRSREAGTSPARMSRRLRPTWRRASATARRCRATGRTGICGRSQGWGHAATPGSRTPQPHRPQRRLDPRAAAARSRSGPSEMADATRSRRDHSPRIITTGRSTMLGRRTPRPADQPRLTIGAFS